MKVALVDKDAAVRRELELLVVQAGCHPAAFPNGRELMRSLHRDDHDILVIDWNLADVSGPGLLEGIRNQIGAAAPILLLTAPLPPADQAAALHAGADCLLAKPCPPEVFVAQLRAMVRRSPSCAEAMTEVYGRHTFDLGSRKLLVDGQAPHLTPKEFTLALLLFRNLNRAVSRTHLLETIWGIDPALATRTLDIHISKIRTKLGLRPESGYRLSPVYGFGYRLEEHRS